MCSSSQCGCSCMRRSGVSPGCCSSATDISRFEAKSLLLLWPGCWVNEQHGCLHPCFPSTWTLSVCLFCVSSGDWTHVLIFADKNFTAWVISPSHLSLTSSVFSFIAISLIIVILEYSEILLKQERKIKSHLAISRNCFRIHDRLLSGVPAFSTSARHGWRESAPETVFQVLSLPNSVLIFVIRVLGEGFIINQWHSFLSLGRLWEHHAQWVVWCDSLPDFPQVSSQKEA